METPDRDTMIRPADLADRPTAPEALCGGCGAEKEPHRATCWACWHRHVASLGLACTDESCPEHGAKREAPPPPPVRPNKTARR